ncbi:MAG TPA: metallophosphoesterase [Blastocatellia bacterium]|jgi:predicted phosphohydrolase
MRVFAIGDMHLEGGTGKTMEKFGEHWRDHDRKIFDAWQQVGQDDDLLVIAGDTSWAMKIDTAKADLERIGKMKGRKILIKGNHDYWWQSRAKMKKLLDPSIEILQASSTVIKRVAIAGTRGWLCPNDTYFEPDDEKIYEREVGRLRLALEPLRSRRAEYDALIVALHYPPANDRHEPSGFTDLIDEHAADACVYGHLHGESIKTALTGMRNRTRYFLVSADAVNFAPAEISLPTFGGISEA